MDLNDILISPHIPIREAIKKLNETAKQILLVVNSDGKIIGTITDGDVRRALIRGVSLDQPAGSIMNKNPKTVKRGFEPSYVRSLFLKYGIKRIPVVDEAGRVKDLLFIEDFIEKKRRKLDNIVVIMAGGRGKRLDPLTRIIPKPLIPIGEKSMLEHIIERFANQGFRRFILTLHYKKDMIKMYVRDLNLPYDIDWVEEEQPMGTAGGLSLLKGKITSQEPIVLTNCDVLLDLEFAKVLDFHKQKEAVVTIVGALMSSRIPYGILKIENGYLMQIEEKPSYDILASTGVYVLEPQVVFEIPEKRIDMPELLNQLLGKGERVAVYPYHGKFFDIGQWDLYRKVIEKL